MEEATKWDGAEGLTVELVRNVGSQGEWIRFSGVTEEVAFFVTQHGRFRGAYADVESLAEAVDLSTLTAVPTS